MTNKQIEDAISTIQDSLETNDIPIEGVYEKIIQYLRENISDIQDPNGILEDLDEDLF